MCQYSGVCRWCPHGDRNLPMYSCCLYARYREAWEAARNFQWATLGAIFCGVGMVRVYCPPRAPATPAVRDSQRVVAAVKTGASSDTQETAPTSSRLATSCFTPATKPKKILRRWRHLDRAARINQSFAWLSPHRFYCLCRVVCCCC